MEHPGRLKINMLGTFQIAIADEPVHGFESARLQSFLARLVLNAGVGLDRAALAYEMWPESTDAQARANLRKLLHVLKKRLPQPDRFLTYDRQLTRWRRDAPCTVDVQEFMRLTAAAAAPDDLARAVSLYGEPLLPGCYDDWALATRERLNAVYSEALERLATDAEQRGEFAQAAAFLERRLEAAPHDEVGWERLMQAYAAAGQRGAALAAYSRCQKALQDELGVEPPATVQQLYRRLRAMDRNTTASVTGQSETARPARRVDADRLPLIGRDRETNALRRWCFPLLQQAGPGFIQIAGEAGVGKTRLAEDLINWAAAQGAVVVSARAYRPDQESPLGPVRELLQSEPLRSAAANLPLSEQRGLAALLPGLVNDASVAGGATFGSAWHRQALFDALNEVLLATSEPLLLVADDLQWWDRASVAWLHHVFARLGPESLVIVATCRVGEPLLAELEELLAWLQSRDQLRSLELGPLNAEETARLIAAAGGEAHDPDLVQWIYHKTEGNPLFVLAWVQAQLAGASNEAAAFEKYADPVSGLPAIVHGLIMSRLLALSAESRQVADAAAALGRGFSWELIGSVSGLDTDALVTALDELCLRRVLQARDDGTYDFAHGRIRDVVEARLSTARRRFLHSRAADALVAMHGNDAGPVAAQLAVHFEQAGRLQEAAVQYGHAAAQAADVYANERALALYRKALAVLHGGRTAAGALATAASWDEAEANLWEGLGDLAHHLGQQAEAESAIGKALSRQPALARLSRSRLLRKLGNIAREREQYDQALQMYAQAEQEAAVGEATLRATATADERAAWLDVQLDRMDLYYRSGDRIDEMLARAKTIVPFIEQYADKLRRCRYYQAVTMLLHRADRFASTDRVLAEALRFVATAVETGHVGLLAEAQFGLGFVMLWRGPELVDRPLHVDLLGGQVTAETMIEAGLTGARKTGDLLLHVRALTYLAFVWRFREDVARVAELSREASALAAQAELDVYVAAAFAQQAWVAWRRGDHGAVGEAARAAERRWAGGAVAFPFAWAAHWPLLATALAQDDVSAAADCAACMLAPDQQSLPPALHGALAAGLDAWRRGSGKLARHSWQEALAAAQSARYC